MSISLSRPSCSICREVVSYDKELTELHPLTASKTKHLFHRDCINSWLFLNDSCPVCKCSIITSDSDDRTIIARIGTLFDVTIHNYPDLMRSRTLLKAISENNLDKLVESVGEKPVSAHALIVGVNIAANSTKKSAMIEILLKGQTTESIRELILLSIQVNNWKLFENLISSSKTRDLFQSERLQVVILNLMLDKTTSTASIHKILDIAFQTKFLSYASVASIAISASRHGKTDLLSHIISQIGIDEDTRLKAVFSVLSSKDNNRKIETLELLVNNQNRAETIFYVKQESQELNINLLQDDPILAAIFKDHQNISVRTLETYMMLLGLGSFFILYYWIIYIDSRN